jgi:MFS family permease
VSDPVLDVPREVELTEPGRLSSFSLLREHADFRTLFGAVCVSELGDALNYIALMWLALERGGALGVVAVRFADSVPAFLFGLHGGVVADRLSRKRLMIGADVFRGLVLVPVAIAGLSGSLPLWGLVVAAFVLEGAASYYAPAYGATIPAVVDRENVQGANALVQAAVQALSIGGWALAAVLLAVLPISTFFAVDAVSFFVSAALTLRIATRLLPAGAEASPRLREGIDALRPLRNLFVGVVVFGVAMTFTTGSWISGVPTLVRSSLHRGAGGFSVLMIGFAVGAIVSGAVLARVRVRNKARASMLAWLAYLPAYGLIAVATSLPVAVVGAVFSGAGETFSYVLLNSAAQEEVPDRLLGRATGVISFVHRGAHATGLLLVSPLFAVAAARPLFGAAAVVVPLVGLAGVAIASRSRPAGAAR